ncbi:MAG TPA: PEP/pyruvate-binding domain-containing protein [Phycisphaerae bacterium]|nr:PEP/pyruvate-binding domain-containing protein [Phycisphaerae bacterium]HNU43977.1 PEP/pyruvate-binding domain-containing protein [Phycisphaerae bacterium]
MSDARATQTARCLDEHVRARPGLREQIFRQLLLELHARGYVTVDGVYAQARALVQTSAAQDTARDDADPASGAELADRHAAVDQLVREYACRHFTPADIDDLVNVAVKGEQIRALQDLANRTRISCGELLEAVHRFCQDWELETDTPDPDVLGTRAALIRHLISDQLEFIGVAKHHLPIRYFDQFATRIIGPPGGMGRIGGKAGGMVLACRLLEEAGQADADYLPTAMPQSWFLRSDVVQDFVQLNRFSEYQSQKYKPLDEVARDYPLVCQVFRSGAFPAEVLADLRGLLREAGTHPLIVRSSSLLEDRFGAAFYGKYASVFLANQGSLEQRLRGLLEAIAEVYASVFAPEPILYRREHNLLDYVEEMAVLIQKVVGFPFGPYFLPAWAGVGFSRNEYRWSPRIRREDGLLRMVLGLGTRAVDRGGSDFPRLVALGEPTLRPECDVEEISARAQREVDVVDLHRRQLRSVALPELLAGGMDFPMLDGIVSVRQDDGLYTAAGALVSADPATLCITFEKLLRSTPFAQRMQAVLGLLEKAYGRPVEVEFACDGRKLYVLQCRPQAPAGRAEPVPLPRQLPPQRILFDARRMVRTGLLEGIEYIVYVDPRAYDALPDPQRRWEVAGVVGRVNRLLPRGKFILMGPGRWGSRDLRLGVPVRYADINHTALLVEIARESSGFVPAVSFGTHFFQDLIEAGIHYLPLYPDEKGSRFNEPFFVESPNALASLLPEAAGFAAVVRVLHVPAVAAGATVTVAMDGETDQALAYL